MEHRLPLQQIEQFVSGLLCARQHPGLSARSDRQSRVQNGFDSNGISPPTLSPKIRMSDPAQVLRDFKPTREFFVGIDSDGCIFDSMEIKHKECFAPMFIKHFELQAVSKYGREVWEFVNLYSKTRGANRFPALVWALDLLRQRPQVQARGVKVPETGALKEWVSRETKPGNATLNAEVQRGNRGLEQVKRWSDAVNAQIEDIVRGDLVADWSLVWKFTWLNFTANFAANCLPWSLAERTERGL